MKLLFFILAITGCSTLMAQMHAISFENTWRKGSNIVYAGVVNELIIMGNTHEVTDIRSSAGSLTRRGDTLLVKNNSLGPFTIELIKGEDVDTIELKTELLPQPGVSLTGGGVEEMVLSKSKVLENGTLNVFARLKSNENLFDQYELVQYEITVGNTSFKVNQTTFTPELREAIQSVSPGKNISVNYLCLVNKETGKRVRLDIHKVFRID
jgi:hypothetical protein